MPRKPRCPKDFDAAFGRRLVKYLGGDTSKIKDNWCWEQFAEAFPELREKAER